MSYREYVGDVTADTTLVTTAETVVATVSGVSLSRVGQAVKLRGEVQVTIGTATTGVTLRVRRDALAGALVSEANLVQIETAAGSTEDHNIQVIDSASGELAGATYVLTVQQTAATGNGTVLRAQLVAGVDS